MNNVTESLGMVFKNASVPDFGSIERTAPNEFSLLAADISKLNSTLTKSATASSLAEGHSFNIPAGAYAIVVDHISAGSEAVYRYHEKSDTWYEVIGND